MIIGLAALGNYIACLCYSHICTCVALHYVCIVFAYDHVVLAKSGFFL